MARTKSGDKRNTILAATTEIVAEHGTEATTAKIAKLAAVAEGSLFTYFENKDDLFNQLYLEIKNDLLRAMMEEYPANDSTKAKFQHVWVANVRWGIAYPSKRKAIAQLGVSERVTTENKSKVSELFSEVIVLLSETVTRKSLTSVSLDYAAMVFGAVADATIDFMLKDPQHATAYEVAGFEAVWSAIGGD
ncbi:TetR/AcrR family transcriptional regulator [bacterium]|nr:MAG: TetR/AcrR family transcriptional regulator [bacterium]